MRADISTSRHSFVCKSWGKWSIKLEKYVWSPPAKKKRFCNYKMPKEMSISYQMSHFWRLCLLYREMKNCYYEKLSNLTTCHFTLLNSVMVAIYKRDKLHSHDYHVKATYFNFWPCTRVGNIIGPQFVSIARFVSVAKTI